MKRGFVMAMAGVLAGGLWGCAGSGKSPALPTVVDASAGDLVASEGLALWLGAGGPSEVWMKISEGKDAGKSWHVVPTSVKKGEGGGIESFTLLWTLEGEASARSEREMIVEADGDLTMSRVVQRDRSVITVFDPPVLVMPARINSGAVVRQDGKVVVYELKNPKKVKEKGEFVLEARFEGEVETAAGGSGGEGAGGRERLFTTRLELNLSAAKSERATWRRFAPAAPAGNGALVSESFEEKIRVLGVTIESTRQTMVVAGSAGATCDTDAGGAR